MKKNHIIVLIHVTDRTKQTQTVQEILSEYGCYIKTRLGLHDATDTYCSTGGIIVLEMLDNEQKVSALQQKLATISGIEVKITVFTH